MIKETQASFNKAISEGTLEKLTVERPNEEKLVLQTLEEGPVDAGAKSRMKLVVFERQTEKSLAAV